MVGGSKAPPPIVMMSKEEAKGGGLGICSKLIEKMIGNMILINSCAKTKQYKPEMGEFVLAVSMAKIISAAEVEAHISKSFAGWMCFIRKLPMNRPDMNNNNPTDSKTEASFLVAVVNSWL